LVFQKLFLYLKVCFSWLSGVINLQSFFLFIKRRKYRLQKDQFEIGDLFKERPDQSYKQGEEDQEDTDK